MQTIASNLYLGACDPGIKDCISVLKKEGLIENDVPTALVSEHLHGLGDNPHLKNEADVLEHLQQVADLYEKFPGQKLLVAGDHALGIPTVADSLKRVDNLGVVWIDAHADINTDKITNSGHIHGMPVASLLGLGEKKLTDFVPAGRQLKPENIVYLGLRDVEPEEQNLLDQLNILNFPAEKIRQLGMSNVLKQVEEHFKKQNVTTIHLSYDLDSADPALVPGVTTAVPRGFTWDETMAMLEFFTKNYTLSNADIVEFNVANDVNNQTLAWLEKVYHFLQANS
ncbi:arginase family protein [Enterococcus timonensis]|uniref:arginase family protein n=1 Tax=Enterococcus timonensis TaxID=1852364 RepID=UPI0008D9ECBC|nr:arginase family protein [Enterococcus timonensis]